jgi:DNA gyrase subunit A
MRTKVSEIRETGRNASGVRLIRIDEGDRLVAMSRVDPEEEKGEGGGGEGADAPLAPEPEASSGPSPDSDAPATPD